MTIFKNLLGVVMWGIALWSTTLFAQEQAGLSTGNYAGTNGLFLNPASTANYPLNWELNLVSAGAYFGNNYAYLERADGSGLSGLQVLRNTDLIELPNEGEQPNSPNAILLRFYRGEDTPKNAYLNVNVVGPSFLLRKDQHSFGIFTRARSITSVQRIHPDLAYPDFDENLLGTDINANAFKVGMMNWAEIGLHYGVSTTNTSIGINARYLQGYDAAFFNNNQDIAFTELSDALNFPEADFTYGFATNYDIEAGEYNVQANGRGAAFDLGFQYWEGGTDEMNYRIKIGISLLDVGLIRFGQNAQRHQLSTNDFPFIYDEFADISSEEEAVEVLSTQAFAESSATYQQDNFNIWLPTAFSAQVDFQLIKNFYLNAAIIRRIKLEGPMVERQNSFSLSARLETRWFELFVPLTYTHDGQGGPGLAVRVGPLTVGTDRLYTFLSSTSASTEALTGSDIYASLKIRPVSLKREKKNRKYNANTKSSVDCPKFQKQKKLF